MIKSMALETAVFGVRVNGVATGVTKTAARIPKYGDLTYEMVNSNRELLH